MPTYDFKCLKCGTVFEKRLPMGHKETPKCLDCGHHETQKMLSAPSIIFKGQGFYKTDNRSGFSVKKSHSKNTSSEKSDNSVKKNDSTKKDIKSS